MSSFALFISVLTVRAIVVYQIYGISTAVF